MHYWLEFWWLLPIALAICVLVCLVGVEGSLLFAPFYAVAFPWLSGHPLTPLQAIQIGIISEIFGFSSSFIGFARARLIDLRLALRTAVVGAPLAVAGVFLAYRIPQPALLVIIALALPALAWYLRRPVEVAPGGGVRRQASDALTAEETVRAAAVHLPLCCYSSGALYASAPATSTAHAVSTGISVSDGDHASTTAARAAAVGNEDNSTAGRVHQHRDRSGRTYRYDYRGGTDQLLVGALGGTSTGLVGFGIGVLGVSHLVLRRVPIRIAVGTSHFVILLVTGAAVAAHLVEIVSRGQAPPWNVIAANVVAVLVGGQLAAWLAGRLPEHRMRQVLVTLLLALSAVTLFRAWLLVRG
ncbi:MAG: sulfite exporter TauE/SafE family protein [Gemmatimonadaceae bacterium]|nr:sulfite exporter TauE/SafE family protein [Gemmatimonadaceae bacterium]